MAEQRDPRGDLSAAGALVDPVRRRLYDLACSVPGGLTRSEAASRADVAEHTARFHLDRLAAEGLLATEHRRPEGRGGPGAGRPAKYYRRAEGDVVVTVPPRSYGVAGALLAAAVERALSGEPLATTLTDEAVSAGREVGASYDGPRRGGDLAVAEGVLAQEGYEPARDQGSLVVRNCPFDALARRHTALVCGLNVDYVTGLMDGAGCDLRARLDPGPDRCCVRVVTD